MLNISAGKIEVLISTSCIQQKLVLCAQSGSALKGDSESSLAEEHALQ